VLNIALVFVGIALHFLEFWCLQVAGRLDFEITQRERGVFEQILKNWLIFWVFRGDLNQIIGANKLDVLELDEVCDVEVCATVYSDLGLSIPVL